MARKTRKLLNKRGWLNKSGYHSTAFYHAKVTADIWEDRNGKPRGDLDGTITISDCSRQITIEVGAYSKGEYQNSVYKLNKLIEVLTQTRDAVIEGWEAVEEAKK